MITVNAIVCKKCDNVLFSRHIHDFRECDCGAIAIDGGFDYLKICGNESDFDDVKISIDTTIDELYHDWDIHYLDGKFGKYPNVTFVDLV